MQPKTGLFSFLLTQSVISLLRVQRSVRRSLGPAACSAVGLLFTDQFPMTALHPQKEKRPSSFSSPSALGGLAFCQLHLCKAATKEAESTCRHSDVESRRAGAKVVCPRVSPTSSLLPASVLREACDCGDAWMRSTHLVSSDFMDLHAFLRQHERAFSKGFPFSLFLMAPAWCRQVSFFFKKLCSSSLAHTEAPHTHAHTPLPAMYLSGLPPAVYQTNVLVVFSSTGLNILFHFPLPYCLTHKCMPHTHTLGGVPLAHQEGLLSPQ